MATRIMKCVAIAALLVSIAWSASSNYRVVLAFIVTVGAIAVLTQAARAKKTGWVVVFTVVATLLNPALTGAMGNATFLWADLACLTAFSTSLLFLKNQPILSMASITDRTPGSESL